MKILHCCLSNFYVDGYNYQENMLVREHVRAGHSVLVMASTEIFDNFGRLSYRNPGRYRGTDEADVLRIPYRNLGPHFIMKKIRAYKHVYFQLCKFKPDVIVFHGACAWELLTILRYKKKNPLVKLFIDSHEDFNNSARTFISKNLLHRLFYRPIFLKSIHYAEKILCISIESINFIRDFYSCPIEKIEFFPLGGVVFSDEVYKTNRESTREKYLIPLGSLVFLQSGKFDSKKKLAEALKVFNKLPNNKNIRFIIVGVLSEEVRGDVEKLINNNQQVTFLGWKSGQELMQLLCAADVYVQPGSQSATLQNSICCRCAVIVDDVQSHKPYVKENGWLTQGSQGLEQAFGDAIQAFHDGRIEYMQQKSLGIAKQMLDYEKLAKRLTR